MKKYLLALGLIATLVGMIGCEPISQEPTVAIDQDTVNLFVGQKDTLTAIITPEETVVDVMIWESSNTKVATINADGVISARSEGEAVITLTTTIGSAQCVVNVVYGALVIDKEEITCQMYETNQLTVTKPEHKATAKVTWKSSNTAVASVDGNGNVTALKAGKAVITASVTGCKSVQCNVTVENVEAIFDRKYLIEHFTTEQCGYCPYGMYSIVEYLAKATTPTIWVSHHAGFGTDEYTIKESQELVSALGVSGAPSMAMNRTKQEEGEIFHPGYLPEITIADAKTAAMSVNIAHTYDASSRKMDITVSGESSFDSNSKFLLSVLVKENRLVGKQADYYYALGQNSWKEFMHARVIRDMLTLATGDTIELENQAYSKTWSYTIPQEWVAENCCVVAYITPVGKKPVINAEQVVLVEGTTGGEEYNPYGITESKGPNSKITFHSVEVSRIEEENLLEVMLVSNTKVSTAYGDAQPIGAVYIHTDAETLTAGTYPIKSDGSAGSIQAGYRIDEMTSFGGSLLMYALSEYLANGMIGAAHFWRMNEGEMVVDEVGNITFNFKTYNGTSVTSSYASTSSNVAKKINTKNMMVIDKTKMHDKTILTK